MAGDDGTIYIYSSESGDITRTLINNNNRSGSVNKLVLVKDDYLCAAYADRSIKIWSLQRYEVLHILRDHHEDIEVHYFFFLLVVLDNFN